VKLTNYQGSSAETNGTEIYPPTQKTPSVSPGVNASDGPSALRPKAFGRRAVARRAPGLRSRSDCFGGVGKEGECFGGLRRRN